MVVFECSVFHNRLSGRMRVTFLSCTDKLHLPIFPLVPKVQHCSTEVLENRDIGFAPNFFLHLFGKLYSASDSNNVNILTFPAHDAVANKASDNVSVQSQLITRLPDNLKDRETQFFFQISHSAKLSKIPESKTHQSKNAAFSYQESKK